MTEKRYLPGTPRCFKAYDLRGSVPSEINEELAFKLGNVLGAVFGARTAIVGHDARLSGPGLASALAAGMNLAGVEVADLGLCGTEEIYFASASGFDIGIMVTGSHNPIDQNGFKIVKSGALPVSESTGLAEVADRMRNFKEARKDRGRTRLVSLRDKYIAWLKNYIPAHQSEKSLSIAINAGNGSAGPMLEALFRDLPFDVQPLNFAPDGTFPHGIPNPLLPECRAETAAAVIKGSADVGIAFDGDFDRCFFYDGKGRFIESYYLVGMMAEELLSRHPAEKIIHDSRLYWNTREIVERANGKPVMGLAGHAFMKKKMREESAVYGGEMSAHHYFRDFFYCDSGMIAMLLVLSFLQRASADLDELLGNRMAAFPCSGEINFQVHDAAHIRDVIWKRFEPISSYTDRCDGINIELEDWRFSLRSSNTEPLLRLNVESRGNRALLEDKTQMLSEIIINEDKLF